MKERLPAPTVRVRDSGEVEVAGSVYSAPLSGDRIVKGVQTRVSYDAPSGQTKSLPYSDASRTRQLGAFSSRLLDSCSRARKSDLLFPTFSSRLSTPCFFSPPPRSASAAV